jgi:hypothetical protein
MRKFFPLFILAISFAYVESAVVVYLRELYYPDGFHFPLKTIPFRIGLIEIGREAATLVMIMTIGFLSGTTRWQRVSYSVFVFGIWDIAYYIWLKIFLDWPQSMFTWDILFLIPVPWVAPVLAPVIIAMSISIVSLIIVYLENKGMPPVMHWREASLIIIGGFIILTSFIWDFRHVANSGIPLTYHWELLITGEFFGLWGFKKAITNS